MEGREEVEEVEEVEEDVLRRPRVRRLQAVVRLVVQHLGGDVGRELVVRARVEQAGDERPRQRGALEGGSRELRRGGYARRPSVGPSPGREWRTTAPSVRPPSPGRPKPRGPLPPVHSRGGTHLQPEHPVRRALDDPVRGQPEPLQLLRRLGLPEESRGSVRCREWTGEEAGAGESRAVNGRRTCRKLWVPHSGHAQHASGRSPTAATGVARHIVCTAASHLEGGGG